jgi:hypothetical protein
VSSVSTARAETRTGTRTGTKKSVSKTAKKLKKAMETLHTWKPEFEDAVRICADLMDQYDEVNGMILAGKFPRFEITETGGTRKSGAVTTTEALRRDILAYLKELGLTVMAVKRLDAQESLPESSVLADALRRMGDSG